MAEPPERDQPLSMPPAARTRVALPAGWPVGIAPALVPPRLDTEHTLDALFETAAVGLAVGSPAGRILRVNAAFAAFLGRRPEELVGTSGADLTHPEDRADTERAFGALTDRTAAEVDVETRYLRPDGHVVWAHTTVVGTYGPDGRLEHTLLTIRDLSAERRLQRQMRDAHARYRRLVEANILGVAVATEAGVEEANDEYLRLAGTTRARFETEGLDWQAITPPAHLLKDRAALAEILARGTCTPFEKAYVRADGTRVPVLVGGALLDRQPLRWIAFALDLSERRQAEAERDRLLLEAEAARQVAEAALHARDALLARVTHDLRTPIAANAGYAAMLRDGIPVPLAPAHQSAVERMLANQQLMLALIDSLLDFARGATGQAVFRSESVDVASLLTGVETALMPQLRAAELTYERHVSAPLSVLADRVKATQVLLNLVGNASKFTPPGGRVTVAAAPDADRVRIAVRDTGVGILPDHLERVFEPFVEGVSAGDVAPRPGQLRGLGLGLAISRELARGMGGDLTVTSVPGEGSAFTFTLPRSLGTE